MPTARLALALSGRPNDDLDLFLRFDADGDGVFSDSETVSSSASSSAQEEINLRQPIPMGSYLILVHGYKVVGGAATFSLTTDLLAGDGIAVSSEAAGLFAGP